MGRYTKRIIKNNINTEVVRNMKIKKLKKIKATCWWCVFIPGQGRG